LTGKKRKPSPKGEGWVRGKIKACNSIVLLSLASEAPLKKMNGLISPHPTLPSKGGLLTSNNPSIQH